MKRTNTLQFAVLAFVTASGCSGGEDDFSLVGDWFFCEAARCAVIRSAGIRFKADNVWTELSADGDHLEATETYCRQPGQFKSGSYRHEGMTLKIKGRSCGSIVADGTIRVEGDAIVFIETGKAMKRIDPPRLAGTCQGSATPLDAAVDAGGQGG